MSQTQTRTGEQNEQATELVDGTGTQAGTTFERLVDRLTRHFDNLSARAAAINEVLTAQAYQSCFAAITAGSNDPTETLYDWAVQRGQLWN